uniref:Uncharacterized protein n=1 Tax=Anguilla anguilla TaxID=7936 RepID=A0A0E9Q6Z5_ANGAN
MPHTRMKQTVPLPHGGMPSDSSSHETNLDWKH